MLDSTRVLKRNVGRLKYWEAKTTSPGPVGDSREQAAVDPARQRSGPDQPNSLRGNCVTVTLGVGDSATGLGVESMTKRTSKPDRVLGSGHPSQGVKALWAFHMRDYSMTLVSDVFFFLQRRFNGLKMD